MRKIMLSAAAAAATFVALPALAQDAGTAPAADTTSTATAPDGTRAFGIEPYFGVMGGWEQFDSEPNKAGIPQVSRSNKLNGSLVQGVAGVNVPLGPVFVGAEGNVAKGISGDINWEYGAAGRFGLRAGNSGLFYGKVGYQWVNFDKRVNTDRHYNDWTYGVGFEVGPKDIGMGNGGFRLRGEVSTFGDFHSFRPTLGVITHF
ncbi:opacity protein [Sphingomonas sp. TX0543]|uniref:opacity protein n=1 Tax=unclassified Sphingomonas TaxID=196159 RepID=UPI0010FA543B|nr:opacity protein [Sphingomonas sp. 3P27F8]